MTATPGNVGEPRCDGTIADLARARRAARANSTLASLAVLVGALLLLGSAATAQQEEPTEPGSADAAAEASEADANSEAGEPTAEAEAEAAEPAAAEPAPEPTEAETAETELQFGVGDFDMSNIEEILIQGEAGSGIPKAAPISVIGFDMDRISKEGIKDIRDLTKFTPNLEIKSQFAASNPAIFIRGVGLDDYNANAASAVAVYQDGVYMQSSAIQLFGFFDQEGVEVLRGPQGTFYRNASAGAIISRSAKPTEEFEAFTEATYGRFDQFDVTGAVSGPIVPDWLTGRFAWIYNSRGGTVKNRCGAPSWQGRRYPCDEKFGVEPNRRDFYDPGIEDRVNDIENYGLRLWFELAPPTLDMEWLLNFHGGQNLGHAYQYQHHAIASDPPTPDDPRPPVIRLPIDPPWEGGDVTGYRDLDGDPFAGEYDVNGPEDLDIFGTNLRYTWNFGDGYTFESLTAYEWHDRYTLENTDGSSRIALISQYGDDAWQLSEQVDLRGEWIGSDFGDGGWSIGALYLQEDLNVRNVYTIVTGLDLEQEYEQKLRNFGSYAQADYTIRPGCEPIGCDFKFNAGLRYNVEYKKFDIATCFYQNFDGIGLPECSPFDVSIEGTESEVWDGWGGDFIFGWYYDDEESNVYLKYSRGWKGGHFNGGATSRFDIITAVEPEIVDSYELGLRANWLDGRLQTNVTGFYYDYDNLQVFKLEQTANQGFPIFKLVNAQSALIYGLELEIYAKPVENMDVSFAAGWVESEYDEFTTTLPFRSSIERPNGGRSDIFEVRLPFSYTGNDLIASPRFAFTGAFEYAIPLPGEILGHAPGSLVPRYSFSWRDQVYFDPAEGRGVYLNFPKGTFAQPSYWVHNAGLSWRSEDEMVEITGWVHNFLDEWYKTSSDDNSIGLKYILNSYDDPRTYGITVSLSF